MATTKLLTAEDLWLMDDDEQRYELVKGELLRMSPSGGSHSQIGVMIASYLNVFAGHRRLGYVFGADAGFLLARDPDTVRSPDVAFIRASRLPEGPSSTFVPVAPDIAVEIISPSDRQSDVQAKVFEYLDAGVEIVWLVDPPNSTVSVYRNKQSAQLLHSTDTLDGGDVLPGFEIVIASIFEPWLHMDS